MAKRVIFHVGLPKTGTATIQQYLRSQDQKLSSLGFLYPGPREHKALHSHKHLLMLDAMKGKASAPSEGLDAQACREVIALTFEKFRQSDLENLIWSCEGMALSARNWDAGYLDGVLGGDDVRIVCFVRYTDDWVESLIKERIRGQTTSPSPTVKQLRPPAPASGAADGATPQPGRSMLERGPKVADALRAMRGILPGAEIVVRSFDANRAKGKVVSGAMEAMGVPVADAFPDADDEAGVRNPTKSDLYSMLLYHLITAQAGKDVIRQVAAAAQKRDRRGAQFAPLAGRRFRFLSEENIMQARGYYEELRGEYPDLPAQPPYVSKPAERRLPKDEGVALLDWLRPDISDAIFDRACAAYPEGLGA